MVVKCKVSMSALIFMLNAGSRGAKLNAAIKNKWVRAWTRAWFYCKVPLL
jgi:hypothetical protein